MNAAPTTAGYSGRSLSDKLGMKPDSRVVALNAPPEYRSLLEPLPKGLVFEERPGKTTDLVHLFVVERAALAAALAVLRRKLRPQTPVWVSWPKKSSKVPTTITEDVIREVALPLGFVDIKVCAVSEVWSGLKLVVRKELR
jgi:hypothetical protein